MNFQKEKLAFFFPKEPCFAPFSASAPHVGAGAVSFFAQRVKVAVNGRKRQCLQGLWRFLRPLHGGDETRGLPPQFAARGEGPLLQWEKVRCSGRKAPGEGRRRVTEVYINLKNHLFGRFFLNIFTCKMRKII